MNNTAARDELRRFRIVAVAEATSFLSLLAATAVKYAADAPLGVELLGPTHGALFLVYVLLALLARPKAGWSLWTTLIVLAGAVVPLGGFAVDRWLSRRSEA